MLTLGAALALALVLGVSTTALAGTGVGAVFNLGKTNSANAPSKLAGKTDRALLGADNNGSGPALDLQVGPAGTPPQDKAVAPMTVDSQVRVDNLNADSLDGHDASRFMTSSVYYKVSPETQGQDIGNGTGIRHAEFACDPGDTLLTGGYRWMVNGTSLAVVGSYPYHDRWIVQWANTAAPTVPYSMQIYLRCADTAAPAHG